MFKAYEADDYRNVRFVNASKIVNPNWAEKLIAEEPIIETEEGTYADKDAKINTTSVTWNHSLSEVMSSLLNSGLRIDSFSEFDYSPYNCLNNMVEVSENHFMIRGMENKLPLVYALRALKQ